MGKAPSALSARYRTILLLGAAGAVLFICVFGFICYRNTRQVLAVSEMEERSHQVLSLLETSAQRLQKLDYLGRLYLNDKNKDDLNAIRATASQLDINLTQLESLVWDSAQRSRAQKAHVCTQQLATQMSSLALPDSDAVNLSLTRKMLQCRDIMTGMQAEEESLLNERMQIARRDTYWNLGSAFVFLGVSLVSVVALFWVLLRDARRRAEAEAQLFEMNERLRTAVQTLEEELNEEKLRATMRTELQLCTTPAEAYQVVQRCFSNALPLVNVVVLAVNSSQQALEIVATNNGESGILDGVPVNACCAMRSAGIRYRKPGVSEVDCTHFQGAAPKNYLCVPMGALGEAVGIVYLGCPDEGGCPILDERLKFLAGLAEMSSMWLATLNLRTRLEKESIHDGLTNLFNRRFMEIALKRELRLAVRRESELSLLMLDIDHFKRFNDTFGHEAGDRVLRELAEVLSASVREEDIVCRYGGEEFLLILPCMGTDESYLRAEAIRKNVNMLRLEFQGKGAQEITVSIGVSAYPQAGQTADELIRAADQALYRAKESGRNRVIIADSAIAV